MAQEAMAAIFDSSSASEQMHSAGRMQGFGSDGIPGGDSVGTAAGSYGAPPPPPSGGFGGGPPPAEPPGGFAPKVETGAYSTGRMAGFGNPTFERKPVESSKFEKFATTMASGLKEGVSKIQAKMGKLGDDGYASHAGCYGGGGGSYGGPPPAGGSGGGYGGGGYGCGSAFQQGAQQQAASSSPYKAGQPGGGWGTAPSTGQSLMSGSSAVEVHSPVTAVQNFKPQAAAPEGGVEYEARLVDEVTAPGGMRASISREELRKFITSVKSLDSRVIAALLQARLEGSEWQRRLKALMVVEGLLKEGDDAVLGHFQKNVACIQAQLGSSQASLKEKARKLLDLLGVQPSAPRATAPSVAHESDAGAPPAAANAASVANLLDLSSDEPPPAASSSSMFDGLAMGEAEPEPASTGDGSLFGGMRVADALPAALSPAAEPDAPSDMFAGLALSPEHPAGPATAPAAPPPVSVPEAAKLASTESAKSSMSDLEMMLAQTPSSPAVCSSPAASSSGGRALNGLAAMKTSPGVSAQPAASLQAQQQMAMMQQQMAMMQQQIMKQQQMLRMGGSMQPGETHHAPPACSTRPAAVFLPPCYRGAGGSRQPAPTRMPPLHCLCLLLRVLTPYPPGLLQCAGMGAPRMPIPGMAGPRPNMPMGLSPGMGSQARPMCGSGMMGVSGSYGPISLDAGGGSSGAFSFMSGSSSDAFDFVGAELSKNKRAL